MVIRSPELLVRCWTNSLTIMNRTESRRHQALSNARSSSSARSQLKQIQSTQPVCLSPQSKHRCVFQPYVAPMPQTTKIKRCAGPPSPLTSAQNHVTMNTPALSQLAPELLLEIAAYLPIADTARLTRVCRRFHALFSHQLDKFLRDKRGRLRLGDSDVEVTYLEWAACNGRALMVKKLLETGCWKVPKRCRCTWGGTVLVQKAICRMCAFEQTLLVGQMIGSGGRDYMAVRVLFEWYRALESGREEEVAG
jgi:hypothetical protein